MSNQTVAGAKISERFAYDKSATKGHLNFMVESKLVSNKTLNTGPQVATAISYSYAEIFRTAHWIWFSDPTIYSQYKQFIDPYLNWPETSYSQIAQWLGLSLPPGSFDGGRRAIYVDYNTGYFAWTSGGNIGIGFQVFKDVPDWAWLVIPHETANMFTGEGVTGGWPTDWWSDGRSPFPAMVAVQVEKANNISYWSAHDASNSQDPQYVMFRDQLLGNFGWALFQHTFLLMIWNGVNLATIHSEFENPNWYSLHYLKSHTVAYYLSRAAGVDLSTILNQGTVGTLPPGWSAGPFTSYQINLGSVVPQTNLQSPTDVLRGTVTLTSTASDPDWGIHDQTFWWSTDGTTFYYIGLAPGGQTSISWDTTAAIPTRQNQVWVLSLSHDYSGFESANSISQPFTIDNTASAPSLTLTTTTPSLQGTVTLTQTVTASTTQTVTQQPVTLWATQTVSFTQSFTQPPITQTQIQFVTRTLTQEPVTQIQTQTQIQSVSNTQTVTHQPVTLWATQTVSFTQSFTQPPIAQTQTQTVTQTQSVTQSVTNTITQIPTQAFTQTFTQYVTRYITQSTTTQSPTQTTSGTASQSQTQSQTQTTTQSQSITQSQSSVQSSNDTLTQTQTQIQSFSETQSVTQSLSPSATQSMTLTSSTSSTLTVSSSGAAPVPLNVYLTLFSWNLASYRTVRVDVCTTAACTIIVASQTASLAHGTPVLVAFTLRPGDYYIRVTGSSNTPAQLQHVTLTSSKSIYYNFY
jgi:hypothetical protein